MELKIGDRVRVKSLEWYEKSRKDSLGRIDLGFDVFTPGMKRFCGKFGIIYSKKGLKYQIMFDCNYDASAYNFTAEMFDGTETGKVKDRKITIRTVNF